MCNIKLICLLVRQSSTNKNSKCKNQANKSNVVNVTVDCALQKNEHNDDTTRKIKILTKNQLSLGKAERTAYVRSPTSDLITERKRFLRGDTVPCTLC